MAGAFLCTGAQAQDLALDFPVDCTLGQDCFIQSYVDRDPTEGHSDFGCGHLSYDGHRGTDIALTSKAELARDVAVTAVAPGTVRATRDGMPDISIRDPNAPDVTNRSCGNAVVVTHAGGWETRYCHLKRGSVAVKEGDRVDGTTRLGSVGLSGRTEFPHLHLSVLRNGAVIDPFQPSGSGTCGASDDALWVDPITYDAAGFISAGAAPALPNFDAIKAGTAGHPQLPRNAGALVFWAQVFGPAIGDTLSFRITAPDGSTFQEADVALERDQARAFRAVGRKLKTRGWPFGTYKAQIRLIREGQVIATMTTETQVR